MAFSDSVARSAFRLPSEPLQQLSPPQSTPYLLPRGGIPKALSTFDRGSQGARPKRTPKKPPRFPAASASRAALRRPRQQPHFKPASSLPRSGIPKGLRPFGGGPQGAAPPERTPKKPPASPQPPRRGRPSAAHDSSHISSLYYLSPAAGFQRVSDHLAGVLRGQRPLSVPPRNLPPPRSLRVAGGPPPPTTAATFQACIISPTQRDSKGSQTLWRGFSGGAPQAYNRYTYSFPAASASRGGPPPPTTAATFQACIISPTQRDSKGSQTLWRGSSGGSAP